MADDSDDQPNESEPNESDEPNDEDPLDRLGRDDPDLADLLMAAENEEDFPEEVEKRRRGTPVTDVKNVGEGDARLVTPPDGRAQEVHYSDGRVERLGTGTPVEPPSSE